MPHNLKNKRRICTVNTSDSDSDIPFYRREQLKHVKEIKKNLQTLCDNDSPVQTGSDSDIVRIRQIGNRNRTDVINVNNNKHRKSQMSFKTKALSSLNDSDTSTSEEFKNRSKRAKNKENDIISFESDDNSYNSSASLRRNKRKFLSSSRTKKQANKSGKVEAVSYSQIIESESNDKDSEAQNRKMISKSSSIKEPGNKIDTIEIIEDQCNENNSNDIDIIASTPVRNNKETRGNKQDVPQNYKHYIIKVVEESKNRFTKFRSQITNLQQKYLKDDVVNLQDANDIIFMLICIISRLKEELTEHQNDLMDSYIEWSMQHSRKCIVSSMQHRRFLNNNHLQVQRKTMTDSDSDELMRTSNVYRKPPLQVTKILPNNVQPRDEYLESHKSRKQKNTESPLKENNFLASVQTVEDHVVSQNNQSTVSIFDEVTRVNDTNDGRKSSIGNSSHTKSNPLSSKDRWSDVPPIRHDFFKNILDTQKLLPLDSDVDSTCSTLNLYFSEDVDVDERQTKRTDVTDAINAPNATDVIDIPDATDARDKSNSQVPKNITLNTPNSDNRKRSLCRFNSEETVILPKRPVISSNVRSSIIVKKALSTPLSNGNLIQQPESRFVVPNKSNLSKKYRSKYYDDKKLRMKCQVLIKRCRV